MAERVTHSAINSHSYWGRGGHLGSHLFTQLMAVTPQYTEVLSKPPTRSPFHSVTWRVAHSAIDSYKGGDNGVSTIHPVNL